MFWTHINSLFDNNALVSRLVTSRNNRNDIDETYFYYNRNIDVLFFFARTFVLQTPPKVNKNLPIICFHLGSEKSISVKVVW